ncbi:MAG TPA: zf-HC2 domain-containing protein [Gemmatimonadaceae bacterium]|jgi:anti-sigma factor RsiW
MSHLDEGTIHAWLDDALPADEAARVEAHARECAACAAMVAEARGFIAGASRLVSSLDVVRGNAIPAASAPTRKATSSGSLWKSLKLTPARAAIAATLLIGVASMFTLRHQDVDLGLPAAEKIASPASVPIVGTTADAAPAPTAAPAPSAGTAAVRATAPSRVGATQQLAEDRAATKRDDVARANAAEEPKARVASVDSVVANNAASVAPVASASAAAERKVASAMPAAPLSPVVPPASSAPVARLQRAATDTSLRLSEVTVTGAMTGIASRAPMSDAAGSSISRGFASESPRAIAAAEVRAVGCYSVQLDRAVNLRGFPAQFLLARDSLTRKSVHAIDAGRDSVLNGATWRILTGAHVVVVGPDAQFSSVSLQFALDSTRATVRAMAGTTDATITRMACPR